MSAETLKQIVLAALEAAKAIAKVTPNDLDDKIVPIAELIVSQVFGLFSAVDGVDEATFAACSEAADKIKAAIQ